VIFGPEVCIYSRTHNFDSDDLEALPFDNKFIVKEVTIKDYVWIGRRVIILPGVTIGKAAIIGAGAVISKNVPDYAVAVGNPAIIVRYRNKELVERILQEKAPFVYNKFGHKKVLIKKI
jgi:acetyltransferase-like isoleucine patch superfamily enzyme